MPILTRSLALAAGLLLVAVAPGAAASALTKAFLDNVVPNVDFLDRSSRFALQNSKSARLRAFARGEAREATLAANALWDWTQAAPLQASAPGLDRTPTGSVPAHAPPPAAADARLPLGQEDLDSLEGLEGAAFDAQYKAKQQDALAQVEADYAGYAATGDDPVLLALAKAELPKVRKRLAALGRL